MVVKGIADLRCSDPPRFTLHSAPAPSSVPRWWWRCQEEDAFKCYCGSEYCRGTMAPKKKTDGAGTTKAERFRAISVG